MTVTNLLSWIGSADAVVFPDFGGDRRSVPQGLFQEGREMTPYGAGRGGNGQLAKAM